MVTKKKVAATESAKWEEQHLAQLEKMVTQIKKKYERNGALSNSDLLSFQNQLLKQMFISRPTASW